MPERPGAKMPLGSSASLIASLTLSSAWSPKEYVLATWSAKRIWVRYLVMRVSDPSEMRSGKYV